MATKAMAQPVPIYQLKVTLKESKPPIWRRLLVPADVTLAKLHRILQVAMGWTNSHLHQFIADGIYYGEPHPDYGFEMVNARRTRLYQLLIGVKEQCIYEYDFGDRWEHEIRVEKLLAPDAAARYPCCTAGKRCCPPEDVGGLGGYANFVAALRDRHHPEHREYRHWIGGPFDPEAFDLDAVNQALRRIK